MSMKDGKGIVGVKIVALKLLPNERGRLMEVQRQDEPIFPGFGQVYVTSSYAGVVKAWYRHHYQIDQIASINGLFKLALYDARDGSPSQGLVQEIFLGELAPKLVQIPTGIWHGFKNVGPAEALLLHLNSIAYDMNAPDEDRLAYDDPSIPYTW